MSGSDIPGTRSGEVVSLFRDYLGHSSFILPPLPNTLFTRDTSCWIYGGVSLNPMHWTARRQTLLAAAIYRSIRSSPARTSRSGTATPSSTTVWPRSKAAT